MKTTRVDSDGTVRCPKCGATSFTEKRTGKAKWMAVPTVGVGVLAAPKRLKCSGCGTNLRRGGIGSSQSASSVDKTLESAMKAKAARDKLKQQKAEIEQAKAGAIDDPLPNGVHPKSIRGRQIRKAREKAAKQAPEAGGMPPEEV